MSLPTHRLGAGILAAAAVILGVWLYTSLSTSPSRAKPRAVAGARNEAVVERKTPPQPRDLADLKDRHAVVLPGAVRDAVKAFDPDFAVWELSDYRERELRTYKFSPRSSPSAIIGDFNGDTVIDAALAGRNKAGTAVLAVMSAGSDSYEVLPLRSNEVFAWLRKRGKTVPDFAFDILSLQPKGTTYTVGDMYPKTFTIRYDGIKDESLNVYSLKSYTGSVFWWDDSKKKFLKSAL